MVGRGWARIDRGEGRRLERPGTVVIVGVGLIGGSVGLALRSRQPGTTVLGVDPDPAQLRQAITLGAITRTAPSLAAGVADADVVIICAPVTATVPLAREAAAVAPTSVLITDVGSTKARIVAELDADPRTRSCFVGSHPIAGSERQGVAHARADLFAGRICALTPTPRTAADRLDRARRFWLGLGARPIVVDPVRHDTEMALTSHLPHAVAAALAATVPPAYLPLAAGAYRDGTRVAGAEADLWAGIFLDNRRPILDALDRFEAEVQAFRLALEAADRDRLAAWWGVGHRHRLHFVDGGADPPPPPHKP